MNIAKNIGFGLVLFVLVLLVGLDFSQNQNQNKAVASTLTGDSDTKDEVTTVLDSQRRYRPDFMLPDLSGVMRNITEWQGKVLVINFWATWCPPCIREMPMFVEAQKAFSSRGVQFIGIAIDNPESVMEFVQEFDANYPLLVGDQETTIEVAYQYGNEIGALPYTVVVNRVGEVVYSRIGEMSREMVVEAIALAFDDGNPSKENTDAGLVGPN